MQHRNSHWCTWWGYLSEVLCSCVFGILLHFALVPTTALAEQVTIIPTLSTGRKLVTDVKSSVQGIHTVTVCRLVLKKDGTLEILFPANPAYHSGVKVLVKGNTFSAVMSFIPIVKGDEIRFLSSKPDFLALSSQDFSPNKILHGTIDLKLTGIWKNTGQQEAHSFKGSFSGVIRLEDFDPEADSSIRSYITPTLALYELETLAISYDFHVSENGIPIISDRDLDIPDRKQLEIFRHEFLKNRKLSQQTVREMVFWLGTEAVFNGSSNRLLTIWFTHDGNVWKQEGFRKWNRLSSN